MPAKKTSGAKKRTTTKTTAAKKRPAAEKRPAVKPNAPKHPRRGDLIVIDSQKVGSPPREGEVLEIIEGQVRVSYRVRWPDGHQSVIAPDAGITRIVPARKA